MYETAPLAMAQPEPLVMDPFARIANFAALPLTVSVPFAMPRLLALPGGGGPGGVGGVGGGVGGVGGGGGTGGPEITEGSIAEIV